jgi:plasmid stabilization system protein ParE
MSFTLRIESLAKADIQKAYDWYEEKQIDLGESFLDQIDNALEQITNRPKAFQIRYDEVRINFTKQFPYGIHYLIDNKKVIVLAVFGESQSPDLWNKRP